MSNRIPPSPLTHYIIVTPVIYRPPDCLLVSDTLVSGLAFWAQTSVGL